MDKVLDFILNEASLEILAVVFGAVWAWIKRGESKRARIARVIHDSIGGAVAEIYRDTVRALKKGGKKLSDMDKRDAMVKAQKKAVELAQNQGVSLAAHILDEVLRDKIEQTITKRKGAKI